MSLGIEHTLVLLPEQGIRRCQLERKTELGALARIDDLVRGVSRQADGIAEVVGLPVSKIKLPGHCCSCMSAS